MCIQRRVEWVGKEEERQVRWRTEGNEGNDKEGGGQKEMRGMM